MKKKIITNSVYLFVICMMIYLFPLHRCVGNAMYPSVRDGDLLITSRLSSLNTDDIILYKSKESRYIGRIMAREEQEVKIEEDGKMFIDQILISADKNNCFVPTTVVYPHVIGSESFFVMNDAREDGNDSRLFGDIESSAVIGRVIFVLRRRGF